MVVPQVWLVPSVREANRGEERDTHDAYAGVGDMRDEDFSAWVDGLIADAREFAPRPEGFVSSTHLWWVYDQMFLGRVQIRHRLTPFLREVGGHVGFWIAPANRRRGHATALLRASLPIAAQLGIECLLATCDADNIGSRKAIEANGAFFHDQRGAKLRYWLPTG